MSLRFIGKDPNSPQNQSPTVWVDDKDASLVIQGWKITDDETMQGINDSTGPVPDHETVLRIPERMKPILRKALGDN